jgi:sulfite exporter TauE/SafE
MDIQIWTAFTLGILGSFHCLGMCGPIALSIPHLSENKLGVFLDSLLYNFGRILTYSLMGLVLGLIGVSFRIAGFQDYLSISLGIIILLFLIMPKKYYSSLTDTRFINKFVFEFKKRFQSFLKTKSRLSLFILGFLNGLLPCGLVYIALAGALATAKAFEGSLYMAFFGLGTLPMIAAVYFSKNIIPAKVRFKINKLIPYAVGLVAVLLILRGMSLGIPYISPQLPESIMVGGGSCCH